MSARFVMLGQHPRATGCMQVYELEGADAKLVKEVERPSGLKCGTFGASGLSDAQLAAGGFDGRLSIHDVERLDAAPVFDAKAHASIINCVDGAGGPRRGYGAPEVATAGRDGRVCVWDPRQKDVPVASFEPSSAGGADAGGGGAAAAPSRDCWCVAFGGSYNDSERSVLAGYDNGDVKLFDLRFGKVRWETNVQNGVCGVEFDRKDIEMNKAAVTCLESQFHVFDLRTHHPEKGHAGVTERLDKGATVWGVRHLPQNRDVFVTLGGDGAASIYKYEYPDQRRLKDAEGRPYGVAGKLTSVARHPIASQPIASWDWSPDKEGLAVCTAFDQALRILICTKLNLV